MGGGYHSVLLENSIKHIDKVLSTISPGKPLDPGTYSVLMIKWRDFVYHVERLHRAYYSTQHEIEQRIAKFFPDEFPEYGPEFFEDGRPDGSRCIGDHSAVTMVMYALRQLEEKELEIADLKRQLAAGGIDEPRLP